MLRVTVPRILLCVSASIIPSLLTSPPSISHFFVVSVEKEQLIMGSFASIVFTCRKVFIISRISDYATMGLQEFQKLKEMGPVGGRIVSANHWLRISGILGVKMV